MACSGVNLAILRAYIPRLHSSPRLSNAVCELLGDPSCEDTSSHGRIEVL